MNRHLAELMARFPNSIDAALIISEVNRRYYTGVLSSAGTFFVTPNHAELIIDFRYIEMAERMADGYQVTLLDSLENRLKSLIKKHGCRKIGIESRYLTVAELTRFQQMLPDVSIVSENTLSELIEGQRSIKTSEELEKMQLAQDVTDRCFAEILNFIRPGRTERDVENEISRLIRSFGGEKESFDTIAVSGKNTSMPHGKPSQKEIKAGDFFTLDFGASLNGYCSDMTRTVAVGGVSPEQQKVYETVLKAQKAAFEVIRPGMPCKEVDRTARDVIDQAGYSGCFGHGLGHSLGLEIHEKPAFSPSGTAVLSTGHVLSVEPGIYLQDRFGVRIEDVVAITEEGFVNLTHSSKELIVL